MRIKDEFAVRDLGTARAIASAKPFATIVTREPFCATHMPCLVEDDPDELVILSHVAREDPACAGIDGPVLMIFHGLRGYVSASWYEDDTIPTWNHVTLHVRGTAELQPDALPLLRRTVDHFEAAVEEPWSLSKMDDDTVREMAGQVVAFRVRAESWHAELKLSQDKPAEAGARHHRARVTGAVRAPAAGPGDARVRELTCRSVDG